MSNDKWIDNIRLEIGKNPPKLFQKLSNISMQDDSSGVFAENMKPKILECVRIVKIFLGEIRYSAPNYTLHDLTHSINVIELMGQLVDCEKLSVVEITLLIYSALLHDIGMVRLKDEDISLDEIRVNHGNRSARFIKEELLVNAQNEPLSFGEYKEVFLLYLPLICASHMQDFIFVEKLPCEFKLEGIKADISLCAILLRLADAMDLSKNRAPYALFNILQLKGVSAEHWQKHLSITNYEIDENGYFRVDGICHDERIHRCLFNHFDLIEDELNKVFRWYIGNNITSPLLIKNNIVLRHIDSNGYELWSHSIQMDFPAISKLFMGEHLYGSKKVGLRELIQNSIDACLVRNELSSDDYSYEPKIDIHFDFDNDYFYLRDNGTGMTEDIIRKYFLNIGVSYYGSSDFSNLKLKYDPTGFFGIGFLSCFMLSDEVQVKTCSWQDSTEHILHLNKNDRFVSLYTNRNSTFVGTEIRLKLTSVCQAFQTSNLEILNEIKNYVSSLFWRLNFIGRKNTLTSKINLDTFQNYTNNMFSGYKKDSKINVSNYLDGIEGIILLQDDFRAKTMWELNSIKYDHILTALKYGKIVFGDTIEKGLPFCLNTYFFDGKRLMRVKYFKDMNFNKPLYWAIIVPNSNYNMKYIFYNDIPKEEYISIFSTVSLIDFVYNFPNYLSNGFSLFRLKKSALFEALRKDLNNKCSTIAISENNKLPEQIIGTDEASRIWGVSSVFLKQTYILYNPSFFEATCYFGFGYKKLFLNITNKDITPNTSRSELLYSDQDALSNALGICFKLWLLDKLNKYPNAKTTCKYIAESLKKCWDNDNLFLKSAKEKYIDSGYLDLFCN